MSPQTKGSKNSVNNTIQRVSHAFTMRHTTVAWEEERIYYERSVRPSEDETATEVEFHIHP